MSKAPLMPMATALWLVENTTLTFKQIAEFCHLHEVEVQGIADGEVAKGIKAYNPIITGQLSREEIELSSKDQNRALKIKNIDGVINATDSFFIDNFNLIDKLSKKFSLPRPIKISYENVSINKNIKSFYQVSKKVYSNRLRDDLGYNFIYPKVDEFLNSLLKKELKL